MKRLGVALGIILAACSGSDDADIAAEVGSPDGASKATVFESSGGATTSFLYTICLKGADPGVSGVLVGRLYGAQRNESAYGVNVVWRGNSEVEIDYLRAKSVEIHDSVVSPAGLRVSIRVVPGKLDKAAQSGAMAVKPNPGRMCRSKA